MKNTFSRAMNTGLVCIGSIGMASALTFSVPFAIWGFVSFILDEWRGLLLSIAITIPMIAAVALVVFSVGCLINWLLPKIGDRCNTLLAGTHDDSEPSDTTGST